MNIFENYGNHTDRVTEGLNVKSVLNPILWLCGITTPICFIAAYFFNDNSLIQNSLILVGSLPIVVGCFSFVYFSFKDPNKLQSEDYQLKHETLKIIQTKSISVEVDAISLERLTTGTQKLKHSDEGKI